MKKHKGLSQSRKNANYILQSYLIGARFQKEAGPFILIKKIKRQEMIPIKGKVKVVHAGYINADISPILNFLSKHQSTGGTVSDCASRRAVFATYLFTFHKNLKLFFFLFPSDSSQCKKMLYITFIYVYVLSYYQKTNMQYSAVQAGLKVS